MSKGVFAPHAPCALSLTAARANATNTEEVNSGLESRERELNNM